MRFRWVLIPVLLLTAATAVGAQITPELIHERTERMTAIILEEFKVGWTGIEIKTMAKASGKAEGIESLVYSHVQGNWVHGAGVWMIHNWPHRHGGHPRFRLRGVEWVSLEFSVTVPVPEWADQPVTIMREEDTLIYEDGRVEYLSGPQTELWAIE